MTNKPIRSRMAFRGHPLHPVLIHFPVAALLALIATDLAYWYSGDFFWARVGLWLAGTGTVLGSVAGLAGLVDLVSVFRIRRLITAWCHALLAVMMLSLACFNWIMRLDDPAAEIIPLGLGVSLLTGVLIAAAGALGGQLVYEYAVGVDIDEAQSRDVHP